MVSRFYLRAPYGDDIILNVPLSAAALGDSDGAWFTTPPPRRIEPAAIYDPIRDRMLVFAGDYSQFTSGLLSLPLGGNSVWTSPGLVGTPPPLGRGYFAIYDSTHDRLIATGGHDAYNRPLGFTWQMSLSGPPRWLPLGAPPIVPREGSAFAFDSKRNRLLLFGGLRDTTTFHDVWSLDLNGASAWSLVSAQGTPPSGRVWSKAIYDPNGDRLIVFGGAVETAPHLLEGTNETWALDLAGDSSWSRLDTTAVAPPSSSTGVPVYDPIGRRMLLVGHGSSDDAADLWSLSLADTLRWSDLTATGQLPPLRSGQVAVYDSRRDQVLVFGGQGTPTDNIGVDVLTLRPAPSWGRLSSVELPEGRFGHATIHDWKRDRLVFFGGVVSEGLFGSSSYTNEAWSISLGDLTDIRRIEPVGDPPPPRHEPVGVYDPVGDRAVFFGGWTYPENYFNDTWVLSFQGGPAWQQVVPQGDPPPPRRADAAIYDPVRHRMLVYGGGDANGELGDLWALWLDDPTRWEKLAPAGSPPHARYFPSFTYDPVRDRAIVYGGGWGSHSASDVWSLELSDTLRWAPLFSGIRFPALERHAAVYDAAHDRLLIHGGWGIDYDLISMDGSTYAVNLGEHPSLKRLFPAVPWPDARAAHSCVFDPSRDRMVIWGGTDFGFSYNDTWDLQFDSTAARTAWLLAARPSPGEVLLDWYVTDAGGVPVRLYRSLGGGPWALAGESSSDGAGEAHFDDRAASPGESYQYRVSTSVSGTERFSDAVTVQVPGGSGIVLLGARPNPAISSSTVIAFWLPDDGEARLDVFDVRGRKVSTHEVGPLGKGLHHLPLEEIRQSGVYFARLTRPGETKTSRFVTLR